MRTAIGAALPTDLYLEFILRDEDGFPGGKTGLVKEALRAYFAANPLSTEQSEVLKARIEEANKAI